MAFGRHKHVLLSLVIRAPRYAKWMKIGMDSSKQLQCTLLTSVRLNPLTGSQSGAYIKRLRCRKSPAFFNCSTRLYLRWRIHRIPNKLGYPSRPSVTNYIQIHHTMVNSSHHHQLSGQATWSWSPQHGRGWMPQISSRLLLQCELTANERVISMSYAKKLRKFDVLIPFISSSQKNYVGILNLSRITSGFRQWYFYINQTIELVSLPQDLRQTGRKPRYSRRHVCWILLACNVEVFSQKLSFSHSAYFLKYGGISQSPKRQIFPIHNVSHFETQKEPTSLYSCQGKQLRRV